MRIIVRGHYDYTKIEDNKTAMIEAHRSGAKLYRAIGNLIVAIDDNPIPLLHPGQQVKDGYVFLPGVEEVWEASGIDSCGIWTSMHLTKVEVMEALGGFTGGDEQHALKHIVVPETKFHSECCWCGFEGWSNILSECPGCGAS